MRLQPRTATLIAVAIAAAVLATFSAHEVSAIFTDSATVPANSFDTASCWAAVKSRQTGTLTSSGNGTQTITISSVDTTKAFLIFNIRSSSNRPVGSIIRGRIASATTLEFARVTDETSTITIRWYVVEYACGVTVQRGSVTLSATTTNVAITPVTSLSQAFVLFSKTAAATDSTMDGNDYLSAELTSTSNIQFEADSTPSTHVVWWEVVEFTNAADVNVQRGTTSLLGTATSTTVTIAAVDTSETFLTVNFRTSGGGADIGSRLLRAQLTNSTTITIDRSASGSPDDITEIVWQTIELTGAIVQRGSENFPSGDGQQIVGLSPNVDTTRTIAFASVNTAGGLSGGRSPYVADDIAGLASFTASLSSTQLTLDRTSTAAAADVGWFVIQLR